MFASRMVPRVSMLVASVGLAGGAIYVMKKDVSYSVHAKHFNPKNIKELCNRYMGKPVTGIESLLGISKFKVFQLGHCLD